MKILFVVGGSYKAFYLNYLKKIKNIDLLVFQDEILYEYNYYNEKFDSALITNEMIYLSKLLKCKIIAKIKTNLFGIIKNEILFCDENGVKIFNIKKNLNIYIKNKLISFSFNYNVMKYADIMINVIPYKIRKYHLNFTKQNRFICDKQGVYSIINSKIKRKFRKVCYFSLKF